MKKSILVLATVFMFTAFFTSCRDENKEKHEMEMSDDMDHMGDDLEDAADDTGDAIKRAADDVGDAVEEGVDEVKENTGTGGTDDM
jgi:gas vesicle protein